MKKIIVSLAVVLLDWFVGQVVCTKSEWRPDAAGNEGLFKDSVQLSDAIVDSVMAVRMEFMPQMRTIFMDQTMNATDRQTKMDDLRMKIAGRYRAVGLTDDQVKMIEDRDTRIRAQMGNRPPGGAPNN